MDTIPAFYFDPKRLNLLAEEYCEPFRDADPFRHLAIDDFLPTGIVDRIADEFPKVEEIDWDIWNLVRR
jgi:hypothetical protein